MLSLSFCRFAIFLAKFYKIKFFCYELVEMFNKDNAALCILTASLNSMLICYLLESQNLLFENFARTSLFAFYEFDLY